MVSGPHFSRSDPKNPKNPQEQPGKRRNEWDRMGAGLNLDCSSRGERNDPSGKGGASFGESRTGGFSFLLVDLPRALALCRGSVSSGALASTIPSNFRPHAGTAETRAACTATWRLRGDGRDTNAPLSAATECY